MDYSVNKAGLIDAYRLSLSGLYNKAGLRAFHNRLANFVKSDQYLPQVLSVDNDILWYDSESYIPSVIDPLKKNLVMILGNPAPESIIRGAMFAYENHGKRYHRFWRVLDVSGVLRFGQDPDILDPHAKMERLFNGDYVSPFNIFILPFYSFSTPPSGTWSGVAGVRRLFGRAFTAIEALENERMQKTFDEHLHTGDALLVFQKDAYTALSKSQNMLQPYDYQRLLRQPVISTFYTRADAAVDLICMLPTRLLHSRQTKYTLTNLALGSKDYFRKHTLRPARLK